jgi:hypothetical protein
MYVSFTIEAFACLEVWPLGHGGSVLLSVVAQTLLYNFLCAGFFSLFRRSHWRLSVESPSFCVLDPVLKPIARIELPKEVFTSRARWMPLTVEWNAFTNMFYLLKNILLLILVIFKLKCNKLILKEIMVLNASYVGLHAFSLHRESPDQDPGRRTPHFWGGSVTPTHDAILTIIRGSNADFEKKRQWRDYYRQVNDVVVGGSVTKTKWSHILKVHIDP